MHLPICPGPINRRALLQVGGLSLGALGAGAMMPGLPQLLAEQEASSRVNRQFSVIWLYAAGGPSHLETFDLKPDAPAEYRGPFSPIETNVPGLEICELLPNLSKQADKFALIRKLRHNRNEHSGGTNRLLSGYASVAANPSDGEYPEIGSIVAKHLEDQVRDLPLYVGTNKLYGGGPAYLGPAYSPFMYSGDPNNSKFNVGNLYLSQDAASLLGKRTQLLRSFDSLRRDVERAQTMSALDKFNQRAVDLLTSSRTRNAFDLSREPDQVRDRYGRSTGGQSLLLARRLVEAGVRFVQITANFPVSKETGVVGATNWDDHSVNAHIFRAYEERLPQLDVAIPALLEDLSERGLNQNVLFVFCGEFGRTPRIGYQDKSKRPGRDHWCRAMSIFLAGGGLKMGQVVGATNSRGEDPVERTMDSNCLLATIYQRFGIDRHQVYHDNTGRPVPILTNGEPIAELL